MACQANDFAIVANGGTPSVDTNGVPVGPVRRITHPAPHSATGGNNFCQAISYVVYNLRRLADSMLQTLTAP